MFVKKVLVIDSDAQTVAQWRTAFERNEVELVHECDYLKSIQRLQESTFDLVVADVVLPNESDALSDCTGLAILSYIATQSENRPKVIAVVDSCAQITGIPFGYLLDAVEILERPFTDDTILRFVMSLMQQWGNEGRGNVRGPKQPRGITTGTGKPSQRLAEMSLNTATDAVFWVDPMGRILFANQAASDNLGYTQQELTGTTIDKINYKLESIEQFQQAIWPAIKLRGDVTLSMEHTRKDGTTFPVEIATHYIQYEGQEFACSFVRDITQRLVGEKVKLLDAAVRASQDGFLIAKACSQKEAGSTVVFSNDAYTKLSGYLPEETIEQEIRLLEGAETDKDTLAKITEGVANCSPVHTEVRMYTKNDTTFWCDFQLTPIKENDGSYAYLLMVFKDITRRKQASEALAEVNSAHRAMVELLGTIDGVWDWKIPTDEVTYQPGYRELLGYAGDDTLGLPDHRETFFKTVHPDDWEPVRSALEKSLSLNVPFDHEYRLRRKDGTYIWVHDRAATIYDEQNKPLRMTGSVYDVTLRRETQLALAKEREMLERSNSDLEQFAYVASHDLQEPLRATGGFMELLEQQYANRLDEKGIGYLRKAVSGASRMHQLINDLLDFSLVTREIRPKALVPLGDAVDNACVALASRISDCNAEIECDDLPTINGEVSQLSRLFQNLIDNAIKYCQEDIPRIKIGYSETAEHWIVSVEDNGIGIVSEYRDQVFSIFKRLHRREEYPGTGIGLAICQRVVESHDGSISIEDSKRKTDGPSGCRFVLRFPKPD